MPTAAQGDGCAAPTFPRDPSEYRPEPNGHFHRKRKERSVPGPAIRECIENGEVVEEQNPGVYKLRAKWAGVHYWLVLDTNRDVAVSCGPCGNNL